MTEKLKLYPSKPILVVDDDPEILKTFKITLSSVGFSNVVICDDSRNVLEILKEKEIGLIMLDLVMPHLRGDELLEQLMLDYPEIPVIIASGVNDVSSAVKCIKKGAYSYVVKPVERDSLLQIINNALDSYEIINENINLKKQLFTDAATKNEAFSSVITNNHKMKYIFRYCEVIALSSQPILITGETGTGKELFAKAIYELNGCGGEFVPVSTAGLDDNMFTDTLFGHKKGAFTGASESRDGLISKAQNGVLFLDEIGDLSMSSQVKLLRLLQEKEYSPLGTDLTKRSNAKIVLATHRDLQKLISQEKFRKDLFYRLSMHQFHLPPLRERLSDIPLLLNEFLKLASKDLGKKMPAYHHELINLLCSYTFPGNIREFQGMVYDAVSKHKSRMLSSAAFKKHIGSHTKGYLQNPQVNDNSWVSQLLKLPSLKDASDIIVDEALKRANGNQRIASNLLGITPQALSKRLKSRPVIQ
jgi:DNA-binding NtrC family response regulator